MAMYTITTTVELADDPLLWQVKDLEVHLLEKGRESLRALYLQVLGEYERALLKAHPTWQRKERWKKKVATLFGDIGLERYRIWDLSQKKSRYPLDEALGIGKWRRETASYQDAVVEQTVMRPFRQAQVELERHTGVLRAPMSTWRLTQKAALDLKADEPEPLSWKKLLLPDPPPPGTTDPCPALGVDLDDTYCRSWKAKRWEKDHGVRVAVLYRHKERVGKRWRLKDKQVIASGPGESALGFLDRVTDKAVTLRTQPRHARGGPWGRRSHDQKLRAPLPPPCPLPVGSLAREEEASRSHERQRVAGGMGG